MLPASIPRARAPFLVAKSSTCFALAARASHLSFLWRSAHTFIVSSMERELLDAEPSVPSATFAPAATSSGIGAAPPPASFMLLTGQCATDTPLLPRIAASCFVINTQCAATVEGESAPSESSHSTGRFPVAFFKSKTSFLVSET
ncbi:Uncharacterised protein [uncultured archaeon]|nr:Uncharacterised protein [uncultured archaeon]